ncbi:hypothetical protein [Altererythrobacter sp. Root672]|uniref:hypothetical protein n=1 Tax=Altererythrobacter sp. Root672 TaxID=1736584 RepID=UPI0006F20B28|nr:hypothetical protein [Altererythrobacter sp. Root672]KRA82588.1 hypothetical protein ASD76_00310 [Altererythrobacter sp. Root672]
MTDKRLISALAALTLLSGCGGAKTSTDDDSRSASGEVLEGTASDAMLPVDQVRSQAPFAPPERTGGAAGTDAAQPGEETPALEGATEAAPVGAETPAAAAPAPAPAATN